MHKLFLYLCSENAFIAARKIELVFGCDPGLRNRIICLICEFAFDNFTGCMVPIFVPFCGVLVWEE